MSSDPLADQSLIPIYGVDRTKAIKAFLKEFEQYKSNFPTQTAQLKEAAGRKLLLIQAPITVSLPTGPLGVTLGLLFTTQFPEHPPHCAVLLQPGERLAANLTYVAPNGVLRLPQLPFLRTTPKPTFCDLLLAATHAFENEFPLEIQGLVRTPLQQQPVAGGAGPNGVSPVAGHPTSPGYPADSMNQSQGQGAAPRFADPNAGLTRPQVPGSPAPTSTPTNPMGSPAVAPPPVQRPIEKALAEKVLLDLRLKGEDHLRFRKQALEHYGKLKSSRLTLEREQEALIEKKQTLLTTAPEMEKVANMVKEWRQNSAMPTASSCIVPHDELHAQAIELIAQNHAADDVMELLEKRLKKGYMSCDDYLKAVSEVARKQFLAKLLLKRVNARISADLNTRNLAKAFPSLDPQLIGEILRSSDYDVSTTERRLRDLTH
jgi:hypothetical protein